MTFKGINETFQAKKLENDRGVLISQNFIYFSLLSSKNKISIDKSVGCSHKTDKKHLRSAKKTLSPP